MSTAVFYFQVHQPFRLQRHARADIGLRTDWFADGFNRDVVRRVAERCYLPMNRLLLKLIDDTGGRFRCAFSLSGTVIDQLQAWAPDALASFVALAETGHVEFLCETSHHSLAFRFDGSEFEAQVDAQRQRVRRLFGVEPTTFRNTELVIDAGVAETVERLGFDVLLGEGTEFLLDWRSPAFVYRPRGCERLKLMLRHYPLSDDIGFRFSNKQWSGHPLFADVFAGWLADSGRGKHFLGLYMDYETFGEHQWADTGILSFMAALPDEALRRGVQFATPAEVAARHQPAAEIDIPRAFSWADQERDLSAWLDNPMQTEAQRALYALLPAVRAAADRGHAWLLDAWRRLSTSDHPYYMCTKFASDGDVHGYFSPYDTPHDAYLNFMNVVDDLRGHAERASEAPPPRAARSKARAAPERLPGAAEKVLPLREQLRGAAAAVREGDGEATEEKG